MIVTDENRAAVREFIRILVDLKIDESAAKFIVSALQTLEQMDEMVAFIKDHIDASEEELVNKSVAIAGQSA